MSKYTPNRYSADNGKYERYRNKDGKAEGIIKVTADVGRNTKCPCKSGKKYKDCCMKKGGLYIKGKRKYGAKWVIFKIKVKRMFKRK